MSSQTTSNPARAERAAFAPGDAASRLDSAERRGKIDAQAGVWIAGAIAAGVALALLDRVGAPAALCSVLAVAGAGAALAGCGLMAASARASRFHLAARALTAPYAALALAAPLGAGGFVFLRNGGGAPAASGVLAVGLIALFAPLTLAAARRLDAISAADLEAARFASPLTRNVVTIPALAVAALILIAGLDLASFALSEAAGLSRATGLALAATATVLIAAPGGLGGAGFAAAGAGLGAIGALAGALFLARSYLAQAGAGAATLFGSDGLIDRGFEMAGQALAAGLRAEISTAATSTAGVLAAAFGLALGLSLSPLLLGPAAGAPGPTEARRAGLTLWPALGLGAAMTLALGALAAPPGPEGWREAWNAAHALFLAPGLSGTARGMACAAVLCAGLATAGLAAQGLAAASGRDPLFRVRDAGALSSRRLAVSRLAMAVGVALCAIAQAEFAIEPALAFAAAGAVSAAGLAPAAILAAAPRAKGVDATLGALTGLAVFAVGAPAIPLAAAIDRLGCAGLSGAAAGVIAGGLAMLARRQPAATPP